MSGLYDARKFLVRRLVFWCLLSALTLDAPATTRAESPSEKPKEGTPSVALPQAPPDEELRAEFRAACRQGYDGEESFFGRRPLERLRAVIAEGGHSADREVELRTQLGIELLEQGEEQEAVESLTWAVQSERAKQASGIKQIALRAALALAHLRSAETSNCVAHHNPESCIFPLSGGGVHRRKEHARLAAEHYTEVLRQLRPSPRAAHVAWLLNVAQMASGEYPSAVPEQFRLPARALRSELPFPRWRDRAGELGVDVRDAAGGAVMDDFDGDGLLDLVSSTMDPCGPLRAFRNDGRGGFQDVTETWGLQGQLGGLNLIHGDYDNDGRLDLLVLRGAWFGEDGRIRNSLLRNEVGGPRGRFVDVTASAGLAAVDYPTQAAAWADMDGDGDLDLYVGNEGASATEGFPSQLFRNDGDGRFTDVARQAGVTNGRFAKGVAWGDYDNDGDPDLYVSNLTRNRLYRNNGDGTFTDVAETLGVTQPDRQSFATWFFDYNNDGNLDIFVVSYEVPPSLVAMSYFVADVPGGHPRVYRNDGGRFTDVSRSVGFRRPEIPMGANFGDLDNDGWPDVYLGTGNPNFESLVPNVMYRNVGGERFADVTIAGGFGVLQKGHGIAFGDLDNDGDQDLFHQVGGMFPGDAFYNTLFENPGNDASWITLRLRGSKANSFAIGARVAVRVRLSGPENEPTRVRTVHALVSSGGSFGGSSLQQEIGLGEARAIESVRIAWPGSGAVQTFSGVKRNTAYRIVEGEDRLETLEAPGFRLGTR